MSAHEPVDPLDTDIDDALRRRFPVPVDARLRAVADRAVAAETASPPRAIPLTWTRRFAVAAALALTCAGAWLVWQGWQSTRPPANPYAVGPPTTMADVYRDTVAAGFAPSVICRDEEMFRSWFERQFGQGLTLGVLPPDTRALGLGYGNVLSEQTIYVLVESGETEILLFVDRIENDSGTVRPGGTALHAHRDEIGKLVVYEVSPLAGPRLLEQLEDPDPATE